MLFINKHAEKRSSLEDMTSPTVKIMKCIHVGMFGATVYKKNNENYHNEYRDQCLPLNEYLVNSKCP